MLKKLSRNKEETFKEDMEGTTMIKEIRLSWADVESVAPEDYSIMKLLKDKGFPVDGTFSFAIKPKTGLTYYEFHDHPTGEIVVQWEESI